GSLVRVQSRLPNKSALLGGKKRVNRKVDPFLLKIFVPIAVRHDVMRCPLSMHMDKSAFAKAAGKVEEPLCDAERHELHADAE
uniref:hypothetical protein n=1 Tax=Pseudomonas syringae TaxID=317 RepID=UPI000516B6E7